MARTRQKEQPFIQGRIEALIVLRSKMLKIF